MIARVIVDVASYAIDRPFDYLVPESLERVVQVGSRVEVSFGRRRVIGYIVELTDTTDVPEGKLKRFSRLIDVEPALPTELVHLSEKVARETVCFRIDALQVMLPSAMRATYEKEVVHCGGELGALAPYFQKKERVPLKAIDEADWQLVQTLQRNGTVSLETLIRQQTKKKVERVLHFPSREALDVALEETSARAHRQKDFLQWMKEQTVPSMPFHQAVDRSGVSSSVIQTVVNRGICTVTEEEVYRAVETSKLQADEKLILTDEQTVAYKAVCDAIDAKRQETFLVHGVTGSGKTELYLQSIEHVLARGEQAIVLVPEIALTPQMSARFQQRFGDRVALMHSGLSQGEKYDEWRKVRRGEVDVVVGARSAVYAPFSNLGLIVVDEEHESSYKQEDTPRYHAREVAIWRATYHRCPVLLGSATPSLESFARAQKGVYTLLSMTKRANDFPLPSVEVVDMREELRTGNRSMFSKRLVESIEQTLQRGEQIVLFLNRRGFSSFVLCRDCGTVVECPHCDISLTYHRSTERLKCHYCDYERPVPKQCPNCKSDHIRFFGTGTQKAEVELKKVFPQARVIRMDVDTTRRKGAHEKLLKSFGDGEADILLGTQMIAQGLDFPNITLVGVLAADSALHLADFRAAERTFQLLTQVSGRAGRAALEGHVVVQTYSPEHYAIELAKSQQYEPFYEREMDNRRRFGYPPYYFIVLIRFSHPSLTKAIQYAERGTDYLRSSLHAPTEVIGPAPATVSRVNDRYRYQCLIKYKNDDQLYDVLAQLMHTYRTNWMKDDLRLLINVEPSSI